MHSKENISEIIKNPNILERVIESLPVSLENTRDITNLSVWWILNQEDKENLLRLLDYYDDIQNDLEEDIDPNLLREFKKIGIKIIRFIDSIWTHKKVYLKKWENNELKHKMRLPWVALEYFLIDSISRLYESESEKPIVVKWPSELEWKKVDFILNTHKNIKIWIQLTLSEWSSISKKKSEMHNSRININKDDWIKKQEKLMSSKFIIDAPVFMIINSDISRQTYHNWILLTAFNKWEENWFPSWWPSIYLEEKIQKELKKIWFSVPHTTNIALDFIKNVYEKWDPKKYQELKIKNMYLVYDWDKVKISFFKKEKDWTKKSNFIYSIEIYITDILLKKLLEKKDNDTIENKKEEI